ncbi:MAG: c-type cytochrome [Polyangiales bacterium]
MVGLRVALSLGLCLALCAACSRTQPRDAQTPATPSTPPEPPAAPPPPPDPRIAQGAELYGRMCAVCHGESGEGYKADQAPALAQPDFLASATDNYLGFTIAEGRAGTTMSAWYKGAGGPLSFDEIRALIVFMRTWQKTPSVTLDEAKPRGDSTRGQAIFDKQCAQCHGPTAPNIRIMGRQLLGRASTGFLRHALHTGRPPTTMPSFTQTLGEDGIEDVLSYLRTLPANDPKEPVGGSRPPPLPLGPVPLNPKGREPKGFKTFPAMTSVDIVGPELAKKRRMVLLDARVPSDYEHEHIAGAVSVPFYDPSPYLEDLPKDAWLVCYCGCPHAESGALATKLLAAGFKQVTVLDEGLFAWQDRGYPMAHGTEP